ncbi:hypothetical protein ASZ90_005505 [hydrocarbon metagenome]|uniref:Carboxypeptidase regulatory-like domain-containing protein n=1 Tax=hydrocarbon metagenome TaxID=938273 RepID=A0A0W8FUZ6_9ZZZZ
MKKTVTIIALMVIIWLAFSASGYAWLYYSMPEFRGRVIDAETKQPIEGAVVVVLYYKRSIVSLNPGGPSSHITKARETLTDNKGEFYLPSYSEFLLFSEGTYVDFIFFKPGYMSEVGSFDTGIAGVRIAPEKYFATDVIGKKVEMELFSYEQHKLIKWSGPLGIVGLKKTKTREERRKTRPSTGGLRADQLPIFFKILDDEYKYLYN